ncbi:glycosyltransferase [Ancylobacter terrae]|uniref:glycosyltransferase n=1 Tax=Ancylobacter sp. sgz301288 TaxID=3342077 RepID=UPI00385A4CA1
MDLGWRVAGLARGPQGARARDLWLPGEVAGLAGDVDGIALANAAMRAERLGVGADTVLVLDSRATTDQVITAAARQTGLAIDPLDDSFDEPRSHEDLQSILRTGVLRRADGSITLAAEGLDLRRLVAEAGSSQGMRDRMRLTTPQRLAAFLRKHHFRRLGEHAAFHLRRRHPTRSAATLGMSRFVLASIAVLLAAAPFGALLLPAPLALMGIIAVCLPLLGWNALRIVACFDEPQPPPATASGDGFLPTYTLMVPLYREAAVVPKLVASLRRLNYPAEKLQILMVVERDDVETQAAIARHAAARPFEMFVAPALGPRTKPKALNAALAFARGRLVAIYDAEDEPDPMQLRYAQALLERPRGRIGCVQAGLAIDNVADSWITRQFAAEYAGQFDLLLPLLARLRLPVPLGGTSNHFRRDVLESVGAWDPYNVTEDADLGIRLARAGWRTAVIASQTDEEAPIGIGVWLRQRTRWNKGWYQTLLVHCRRPRTLWGRLGALGTMTLVLLLGGSLLSALIHPFFLIALLADLAIGGDPDPSPAAILGNALCATTMIAGYVSAGLFGVAGMRRRGLTGAWRMLPLIPVYWLLLSLAAWRAMLQLLRDPFRWEKTEHGLARSSRGRRSARDSA